MLSRIKNPYSAASSEWKHFGLGVLVGMQRLKAEDVVSWDADSPNGKAYANGLNQTQLALLRAGVTEELAVQSLVIVK